MKISRKVYFLILVIEECAEIIHRTCKAIRFGLDEKWKPEDGTNREMLEDEIIDLQVILKLNEQEGNLSEVTLEKLKQKVDRKRIRVTKFYEYSSSACGTVGPEDGENPRMCYQTWDVDRRTTLAGITLPKESLQPGMRVICPRCRAVQTVTASYDKGLGPHEAATGPDNALCGGGSEYELFEKYVRPKE